METVWRTAIHPETKLEYKIEMQALKEIRQAILKLDFPPAGMTIKNAVEILAENFELSEEQKNAVYKSGTNIFYSMVAHTFGVLLKKDKLKQPKGKKTPFFPADAPVDEPPGFFPGDTLIPESIEEYYQKLRAKLANELLQQIKETQAAFFEKLVLDLLVKTGYGGSRANAETVGRSGDAGIDGIISGGRPWLDTIYVQVKRWEKNVSRPEIQKFAGALQGQSAQKGIFVTTSNFSKNAREYVKKIDQNVILIDGAELAQLMIDHGFGVYTAKNEEIKSEIIVA